MNQIKKRIKSKAGIITAIAILVILVLLIVSNKKTYTFEDTFKEIKKLDEKYNTNFKEESVPQNIPINFKDIDSYLEELKSLREKIFSSIEDNPTEEERASLIFIDARTLMLLSEKSYILGNIIGPIGLSTDAEGFKCSDSGHLINTAYYFNLSYNSGLEAFNNLEIILDKYRNVPEVWNLIGINEDKPTFLKSYLGKLKTDFTSNIKALEEFCFLNLSGGLSLVNPEDYKNIITDPAQIEEALKEKGLNISYTTVKG